VGGKPYPVSLRVLSFEKMFSIRDHAYNQPAGHTYAQILRNTFSGIRQMAPTTRFLDADSIGALFPADADETEFLDVMVNMETQALEALNSDRNIRSKIESSTGVAWRAVQELIKQHLPEYLDDRDQVAYNLLPKVLTALYGQQSKGWESYKHPGTKATYVRKRG
jgi:hypothetical protein